MIIRLIGAPLGLHSKGRLLALPQILDRGGRVDTSVNTLAYYDIVIISFNVQAPVVFFTNILDA